MKKHINKIILAVILTLSVAATWLYAKPGNVATYYDFINEYNYGDGTFSYEPANEKEEKVPIPSVKKEESPKKEEKKKEIDSTTKYLIFFLVLGLIDVILYFSKEKKKETKKEKHCGTSDYYYYEISPTTKKSKPDKSDTLRINNEISKMFTEHIKDETEKQFLLNRYQDYLAIQEARMNFDYEAINTKTTDEMYNQYRMQLEMIKKKHQRKIMKDFSYISGKIAKVEKVNDQTIVTMGMHVRFIDYIINEKTEKVVFGKNDKKTNVYYQMVFVRNDKKNSITKCPNCGAEIKKGVDTCEFCRSKITKESDEWLLARKRSTV